MKGLAVKSTGSVFHLKKTIGRGGFGTVYLAELMGEGGFSKSVALKILNPDVEEVSEIGCRFRDEARVLGLVRHRSIVHVEGLLRVQGRWALVMEYVEGRDVKQLMDPQQTGNMVAIPVGPALEIAGEVAEALAVAYVFPSPDGGMLNLLHRDIKPSNIQVTAVGEVKVLDFGIARADFDAREAETRMFAFGSGGYMAPERHRMVDCHAGDVYSLGVVLWEILVGGRFGRTSPLEVPHNSKVLWAMDKLYAQVRDEQLVRFVGQMLSFEPTTRPDAREVESWCWETLRRKNLGRGCRLKDWARDVIPGGIGGQADDVQDVNHLNGSCSGAVTVPKEAVETAASAWRPPSARPLRALNRLGLGWHTIGKMAAAGALVAVLSTVLHGRPMVRPSVPLDVVPVTATSDQKTVGFREPFRTGQKVTTVRELHVFGGGDHGRVKVTGDAARVRLISIDGQIQAHDALRPGWYMVEADFGAGVFLAAGSVEVEPGKEHRLLCSSQRRACGSS